MSPLTESTRVVLKQPTGASWRITSKNLLPDDADAVAYIAAVEAADGEALEPAVKLAINSFIKGCKADGIWPAIKASCILAAARTLNGALVPLVGTAPTNYNFVSGDYNRKTGLVGDASTKYLNTNRAENADPLSNCHYSVYASELGSPDMGYMAPADNSPTLIYKQSDRYFMRSRTSTPFATGRLVTGLIGQSRSSPSSFTTRASNSSNTVSANASGAGSSNMLLFNRAMGTYTDGRLAFYSIGEALDLAKLDGRVTALVNALAAAIP